MIDTAIVLLPAFWGRRDKTVWDFVDAFADAKSPLPAPIKRLQAILEAARMPTFVGSLMEKGSAKVLGKPPRLTAFDLLHAVKSGRVTVTDEGML
jgi:hypothetical protein